MKILNTIESAKEFCETSILKQESGAAAFIPTVTSLLSDMGECYDKDFVRENEIPTAVLNNEGGCIVAFPGNIEIGHFTTDIDYDKQYGMIVADRVKNYLSNKGLSVTKDKNDILLDGKYKVFSWASRRYGNVLFTAVHVSINCDPALVDRICTKPMHKIPKGLSDYGITTEEILPLLTQEGENT